MPRRRVGRYRERMARLLAEAGLIITAEDIWIQEGFYRSRYHDLARWGANTKWRPTIHDGVRCQLYSYDRLTDCLRDGFGLRPDPGWQGWMFVDVARNSNGR